MHSSDNLPIIEQEGSDERKKGGKYEDSRCDVEGWSTPEICQFWGVTSLFSPVEVHQKLRKFDKISQ